jgi:hypothetical protein
LLEEIADDLRHDEVLLDALDFDAGMERGRKVNFGVGALVASLVISTAP